MSESVQLEEDFRPVRRYRTPGGGVVTWTHRPEERHGGFNDWGTWECGGCGDRITRAQRWEANKHAQQCHEIPSA